MLTRPGYAYGVNAGGVTVGKVQRTQDGVNVWRAFRWNGSVEELALPESAPNVTLYHNTANDVTASGHALGATDAAVWRGYYTNQTRACVWWAGTNGPALLGTVGWTDPNPARRPGRSEALGAIEIGGTNKLLVVGTGWITPTGSSRAFRQRVSFTTTTNQGVTTYHTTPKELFDLNDPMWSVIPGGWTLVTGEDVNSGEWIVGLGTDGSGQNRGYVLAPQTVAP